MQVLSSDDRIETQQSTPTHVLLIACLLSFPRQHYMCVSKIHDAWSSRVSVRGREFRLNELKVPTLTRQRSSVDLPY